MNDFEKQCLSVVCAGEVVWLHPQRVMFWPAGRILFAADVHVGKEHCFGRTGIAIPSGISEAQLERLFHLCDAAQAARLVILGDFMHATPLPDDSWLPVLSALLSSQPALQVRIVAGNHDRLPAQAMIDARVHWHHEPLVCLPFVLQHEPSTDSRGYVLAGHLHPAWRIGSGRRGGLRAPVFWFREHYAVLPAFGDFTGGAGIKPDPDLDSLYMAGENAVLQVPARVPARVSARVSARLPGCQGCEDSFDDGSEAMPQP